MEQSNPPALVRLSEGLGPTAPKRAIVCVLQKRSCAGGVAVLQ